METLVLAGGDITGFDFNKSYDYIICADRGFEFAIKNNLRVNAILGDFDSLNQKYKKHIDESTIDVITFNKDKDMTDLELVYTYLIKMGVTKADVYGALGNRADHSMANILLLKTYFNKNLDIRIIDKNNYIRYINSSIKIGSIEDKKYLSILPTNEECIFSIDGVKWELVDHKLIYGSTHTISNEIIGNVNIKIKSGDLFLIFAKD